METRNYLEHRFASAVKIQAIARGYIASVIAEENRFSQALEIALTSSQVQSSSSCSIVSREQPVSNAQSDIIATITLQAWWRMMLVSIRLAEDNAATVIQTCFRRYVGAMDYAIVQGSMIEIQAIVRGHIARRRAARLKHQRIYREKYANSLVRNSGECCASYVRKPHLVTKSSLFSPCTTTLQLQQRFRPAFEVTVTSFSMS